MTEAPPARNNTPLVTVVVTYYDHVNYVAETVESLLSQSFQGFEIVLVDDCGQTDAASLIPSERASGQALRIIRNDTNLGLPTARNVGAEQARGDFLVFVDSDDVLEPTFLEETLRKQRLSGADGVYTDVRLFGDADCLWEPDCNLVSLLSGQPGPATFLMSKEVFSRVGGFKNHLTYNCDHDFWISALAHGMHFVHLKKPLYRYRKHAQSLSAMVRNEWWQAIPRLMEQHRDLYERHFAEIITTKERQFRKLEDDYREIHRQWQETDRLCKDITTRYREICNSTGFQACMQLMQFKQKWLPWLKLRPLSTGIVDKQS